MAKSKTVKTVETDVMENPDMTLKEWADKVTELIKQYGENASMRTDVDMDSIAFLVVDSMYRPEGEEIVCKKEKS